MDALGRRIIEDSATIVAKRKEAVALRREAAEMERLLDLARRAA